MFNNPWYSNPTAGMGNRQRTPEEEAFSQAESAGARTNMAQPAAATPTRPANVNPLSPPAPTVANMPPPAVAATPPQHQGPNPAQGNGMVDPKTAGIYRGNTVFDPSNPTRALVSALARAGINPGSMNPVMRGIMSMAPGLAASFMMRGANGQYGDTAGEGGENIGNLFSTFLSQALSGGGGGLAGALQSPMQGMNREQALQSSRNSINAFNTQERDNPTAAMNPFTALLRNTIGNSGDGGAGFISSLYSPFMSPDMGRSYGESMSRRGQLAYDRVNYQDPNNSDVFSYLLGMDQGVPLPPRP